MNPYCLVRCLACCFYDHTFQVAARGFAGSQQLTVDRHV
jgi:hypothetical protein